MHPILTFIGACVLIIFVMGVCVGCENRDDRGALPPVVLVHS